MGPCGQTKRELEHDGLAALRPSRSGGSWRATLLEGVEGKYMGATGPRCAKQQQMFDERVFTPRRILLSAFRY